MRIVILSDLETQSGGAAICASRLAEGLLQQGHRVTRIVSFPDGRSHPWETVSLAPTLPVWAAQRYLPQPYIQGPILQEYRRRLGRILGKIKPDIINVHNLHGAQQNGWALDLLATCQRFAPLVWTLHDMWSFTGRCAYAYDCTRYLTGCGSDCPTAWDYPALSPEKIAPAWEQRCSLLNELTNITAVTPSVWLAEQARAGLWRGRRVEIIPYGLPLDIFHPVEKSAARRALGIRSDHPLLLLAAYRLDEKRKGGAVALDALKQLGDRAISLLTIGSGELPAVLPGVNQLHLGLVESLEKMAVAYSAADIYLHPALADNLPNMVMEAISCGTPVAAFPTGGVPELVIPGFTGWLAPDISAQSLAGILADAVDHRADAEGLSQSCRQHAEGEFSLAIQAQRYTDLFLEL
jgi:glycosyltransferase involved in cell wall biosynthesis